MNRIDLDGRTAVISGGAGGLGVVMAQRMVDSGARVVLWDIDAAAVQAAGQRVGAVLTCQVDVTDPAAVTAATARTVQSLGRIDILVNSAGITGPTLAVAEYTDDAWRRTLDINLTGVFHCCREVVRHMRATGYGRIVNISSIAGKEGNPYQCGYSAAKAGVIALTKSLAKEVTDTDIRVNCVTPAALETDLIKQMTDQQLAYVKAKIPLGRLGRPEEVAALVAWLASEECSFVTAAVFDASGGRATY